MGTGIFVLCIGAVISAYFLWSGNNGQKRDRERDWGK